MTTIFHVRTDRDAGARLAIITLALGNARIAFRERKSTMPGHTAVAVADTVASEAAKILARFPIPTDSVPVATPVAVPVAVESIANTVRLVCSEFLRGDFTFDHVAFLDEMTKRKGSQLTQKELRGLAKIVRAYTAEMILTSERSK